MSKNKLIHFSDDGNTLAICNSSGIVKLWDTTSNVLEHEFHSEEHLSSSVTCLLLSKLNYKAKKRKSSTFGKFQFYIALGTLEGAILIYNLLERVIASKLNHSSTSSVTDLIWPEHNNLISIGEDKKLIIWNVKNSEQISVLDVAGSQAICSLGKNNFVVGNTSLQIFIHNINSLEDHIIPGHKTCVTQLVPIFLDNENYCRYFLSAAEEDRFVYAWSTCSSFKEPVGSFMVEDTVRTVSCVDMGQSSVAIAVTTKKGFLKVFYHHLNGSRSSHPTQCTGCLKIKLETGKNVLKILSAKFVSSSEVIVAYGNKVFLRCERILTSSLKGDIQWVRQDPALFPRSKESTLLKTVAPHIPESAVHLMPTQMNPPELKETGSKRKRGGVEVSLPMEDRLDALSLTQSLGASDSRPLDNYVHLLVQALHSKDASLMNSILAKGDDEDIINNTVRRLPVSHLVPFLTYLQDSILGKGLKNLTSIYWVKSVLYHHMSHLSTVSNREALLQPFYSVFAARTSSLVAVTKLHSRISLLLTHVKNRHENSAQGSTEAQSVALLKYKDDSSDEEDMRVEMEGGGGPSESEDIWDDWSEAEEEEEEDEDDDEEEGAAAVKNRKVTEKRKLPLMDEDCVSVSDSDEELASVTDSDEEDNDRGQDLDSEVQLNSDCD